MAISCSRIASALCRVVGIHRCLQIILAELSIILERQKVVRIVYMMVNLVLNPISCRQKNYAPVTCLWLPLGGHVWSCFPIDACLLPPYPHQFPHLYLQDFLGLPFVLIPSTFPCFCGPNRAAPITRPTCWHFHIWVDVNKYGSAFAIYMTSLIDVWDFEHSSVDRYFVGHVPDYMNLYWGTLFPRRTLELRKYSTCPVASLFLVSGLKWSKRLFIL